jgi:hypothetical protein
MILKSKSNVSFDRKDKPRQIKMGKISLKNEGKGKG